MAIAQQGEQPNRKYPKKPGKNRFAHTQNTSYGMGDNYGSGVKNPVGKMREGMGQQTIPKSKLNKPPRKLA